MKRTQLKKTNSLASTGRINPRGNATLIYESWKHTIAIPYLEATFPHTCALGCGETNQLDVGHILPRSTRPDLKMELTNVRWECRSSNRFGACLDKNNDQPYNTSG